MDGKGAIFSSHSQSIIQENKQCIFPFRDITNLLSLKILISTGKLDCVFHDSLNEFILKPDVSNQRR